MKEEELLLVDRLHVIKTLINKEGQEKFYLSFSGGKDSTILHFLLDEALPGNSIPRVFIDTGIEYAEIKKFVLELAANDKRFQIIRPSEPIKKVLEKYGYPFKSKEHSTKLHEWQLGHRETKSILKYINGSNFQCPALLKYQFSDNFKIKISQYCCIKLKKNPAKKWGRFNNKSIVITGMRREEGGQRNTLNCIVTDKAGKIKKFHPLAVVSEEWEEWIIKKYNIKLCQLYYPPYNFTRTGCKGCPFALDLQEQLTLMQLYLPNERKQCEIIWQPIYEEYRKLNYRLNSSEQLKLF